MSVFDPEISKDDEEIKGGEIKEEEENLLAGKQVKINSRAQFSSFVVAVIIGAIPVFVFVIYLITDPQFQLVNFILTLLIVIASCFLLIYFLYIRPSRNTERMRYIFTNERIILFCPNLPAYFIGVIVSPMVALSYVLKPQSTYRSDWGSGSFYYKDILDYEISNRNQSCMLMVSTGKSIFSFPMKIIFFPQPTHLLKIEEILDYYIKK